MRRERGNRRAATGENGDGTFYLIRSEAAGDRWFPAGTPLRVWETSSHDTRGEAERFALIWIFPETQEDADQFPRGD